LTEAREYFKVAADQGDEMHAFNEKITFSRHSKSVNDFPEASRFFVGPS
jgi:hypothetical protein